jgi:hypothetical protein
MTATLPPDSKSTSRRALLAGALGGLGALAARAIGRPGAVRAADGQPLILGQDNAEETRTLIFNDTVGTQAVFRGSTGTGRIGLHGDSTSGVGVQGESTNSIAVAGVGATGMFGRGNSATGFGVGGRGYANTTGVIGFSGSATFPAPKAKTGVYGYAAQDTSSRGVIGESPAGIGVYGITATGYGGYFAGKVYTTKWYEMTEISTPASPAANRARLFIKDNGSNKTQLCVKFANGTVKILATEG